MLKHVRQFVGRMSANLELVTTPVVKHKENAHSSDLLRFIVAAAKGWGALLLYRTRILKHDGVDIVPSDKTK